VVNANANANCYLFAAQMLSFFVHSTKVCCHFLGGGGVEVSLRTAVLAAVKNVG